MAKNWSVWFALDALNCLAALTAAWSVNKDCIRCCALNVFVCCLFVRLAISICKNAWAFWTAACCLLLKLDISILAKADASAITIACLLFRLDRFTVLAILLFSKATCCSAVKFMLAISLTLLAFITLDWNAWSNSMPINVALCSAASIARCCLLLRFCASKFAITLASACAIGNADSIAACTIACPAILEAPKPLAAISAEAFLNAPAAHAGVLPPSKACIKPSSWPCIVASLVGVASAACIFSA